MDLHIHIPHWVLNVITIITSALVVFVVLTRPTVVPEDEEPTGRACFRCKGTGIEP